MGGIPLVFSSLCVYRIFHEINHPAITSGVLLYIIYPNYYLDMIPLLYYKYIIYIYISNGLEILLQYISIYLYYIYLYIYTIYTYIYYIYKYTIQQPPWFGKHQLIEPGPGRSGSKCRPPKVGPGCDLRGSDGTCPRAAWNSWGNPRKTVYCYDG
jgi:hypothetical protein